MSLPTRIDRVDRRLLRTPREVVPEPLQLASAADVLALVETAARMTQADLEASPFKRARTLGALASVALKALEARDLEARVEALERVLKQRRERR